MTPQVIVNNVVPIKFVQFKGMLLLRLDENEPRISRAFSFQTSKLNLRETSPLKSYQRVSNLASHMKRTLGIKLKRNFLFFGLFSHPFLITETYIYFGSNHTTKTSKIFVQ